MSKSETKITNDPKNYNEKYRYDWIYFVLNSNLHIIMYFSWSETKIVMLQKIKFGEITLNKLQYLPENGLKLGAFI